MKIMADYSENNSFQFQINKEETGEPESSNVT